MTTMAEAIKEFVESRGRRVTADEVKAAIAERYPDKWKNTTLHGHLYACAANNPKSYVHHPSVPKFLFRNNDGTFEIYSEDLHGPNEWAPAQGQDEAEDVAEFFEASISLERDIEDHLIGNLGAIEKGLEFESRQFSTDVGRIDILARDRDGRRVVIELKVGIAKDSAVGQVARYLGWFAKLDGMAPRGMLIAAEFPEGVRYAATTIANLTLHEYKVRFAFEQASI